MPGLGDEPIGERRGQPIEDGIGIACRIDHKVPIWPAPGLIEVARPDALLEGARPCFDAVGLGAAPATGCGFIDIEDDNEVGFEPAGGGVSDVEDLALVEPPAGALVGECRGDEAIGEDQFARGERWADDLFDELGSAGHVEEHLATEGHVAVVVGEQEPSDLFADAGAPGLGLR